MAKKRVKKIVVKQSPKKKDKKTLAIVGLILNIIILPGLGSIIGGRTKQGIWQIVLFVVGLVLSFVLIGIPILIATWIWGIVTGLRMIQDA